MDLKRKRAECSAAIMGDILYIEAPKNKFIPAYVYYLLESKDCNKIVFKNSSKMYKKEDLKGKEDWNDVK
ncbi:MAG: hypothetical protein II625_00130 [Bacilli bacterium]|nr:hypothetical protein [Bacilli bacterium]